MSKEKDKGGFPGRRLWSGHEATAPAEGEVLEKRERKPAATADRAYEAHEVADRPHALEIMRATQPSRFPSYSYLLDIVFDRHLQSAFTLVYTFMIVEVYGCDLAPVVHAISARKCERIREFDRKRHDPPAAGQPIIEGIQITAADEKNTSKEQ